MNRLDKKLEFSAKDTEKIYAIIAKIDTSKGQWQMSNKLSPQTISSLKRSVLITSSGSSTRIEGSKLSDEEVKALFENRNIKTLKRRDEQEVAGYLDLLQNVFNSYETLNFSESLIKSFHGELLKYTDKDVRHRGEYKFGSNRVEAIDETGKVVGVVFDPTPTHLVGKEMQELIDWTKKELNQENRHPLLIIANFVFEFLAIHPFQDGNGRLSRIITNLLLLQSGYNFVPYISHENIIEKNKAEYYVALNKTQQTWKTKNENIVPWVNFFLTIIEKQGEASIKLLTKEDIEKFLSEKQLTVWNFIKTKEVFQRADVIRATSLKPRTIEEIIKKLLRMKKIEKLGEGKATRYRLV